MSTFPWLSALIFLPLVGALCILLLKDQTLKSSNIARRLALGFSGATLCIGLYIAYHFDVSHPYFQFIEQAPWLPGTNISYFLGIDGLALLFILLSTALMPPAILISWHAIKTRVPEYMAAFLFLEALMLGVFCCLDFFLFYIFFEAVLIPMFLIIGIWGGQRRIYAAFKFFLYTLLGSVLMLVAMVFMYQEMGSSSLLQAFSHVFSPQAQQWLWLAFFISFAVKMPMWPFHTWLPDAHVEAPTAGSVLLAGILLKMGGYGFLRFSLPIFPHGTLLFAPWVIGLSLIAIVYTSLVALVQTDIKKLIAYSSVAHMGFVTLGIFSLTPYGISGAIFQMVSHGLISGAIFLAIGAVYERLHTRDMDALGGLVQYMPRYAFFLLIFIFASLGFPGTTGFVGEFLVLLGAFVFDPVVAFIAASAMVIGAAYGLWFYRRILFGIYGGTKPLKITDLDRREVFIFLPLACGIILWGIYPGPVFELINPTVAHVLRPYEKALSPEALSQAHILKKD